MHAVIISGLNAWRDMVRRRTTDLIDEPSAEDPGDDDALVLLLHGQPQPLALLRLGHRHAVHLLHVRPLLLLTSSPRVVRTDVGGVDVAGRSRGRCGSSHQLGSRVIVAVGDSGGKRA